MTQEVHLGPVIEKLRKGVCRRVTTGRPAVVVDIEETERFMASVADILSLVVRSRSSAPEAREGEAVAWIESSDLEHVSEGHPLTTTLFPYAKGDADLALYTHPAAPSADHAELARLAEAASETLTGSGWFFLGNDVGSRFINAMSPAVCFALLSEIAALRASDARTGELLAESNLRESRATVRATQAERQRDELRKALERIADEAPYRSGYCQSDVEYGPTLSADEMQAVARQALANQGADQ